MQTDNIQEAIKDISQRLVSQDPIEHNSAINVYYEPNASYKSGFVNVQGASRIKKVLYLRSLLSRSTEYNGEADWDSSNQILTLNTRTQYGLPLSFHPFDLTVWVPSKVILHLNADEDGEGDSEGQGRKLYVTKMDTVRSFDFLLELPIVRFFHSHFVIPVLSLALLVSAGTLSFWNEHSLRDGIFQFLVAAIYEIWQTIEYEVARQVAGRGWDARTARDDAVSMKDNAKASISQAADSAPASFDEAREQATAGLDVADPKDSQLMPGAGDGQIGQVIDNVKDKVSDAIGDVKKQAPGSVDEAQDVARAKAGDVMATAEEQGSKLASQAGRFIDDKAPQCVKEVKDSAKENMPDTVGEAKAQVADVTKVASDKAAATVDEVKTKTSDAINDKSYPSSAGSPSHPHTPEDNGRSWATVAADEHADPLPGKEPLVLLDKGETGDSNAPEPGHNPTEPGAISYAEAVQE